MVIGAGAQVVIDGLREADDGNTVSFVHLLGRAVGVIATDGHQDVDFIAFDVAEDLLGAVFGALLAREGVGTGREQRGAAVKSIIRNVGQIHDVAVAQEAFPAFEHAIDAEAEHGRTVAHRLNTGVDGRGITTAGKNR